MHTIFAKSPLLIATHNHGKAREISEMLAPLNIRVTSAAEQNLPEPEETGDTFIANASLKARAALEASNLPALADDSGLVIPALGGAPGIYSARWAGPEKNMNLAFERIQKELREKNAPLDSPAYFVCVLALCLPSHYRHAERGEVSRKSNPHPSVASSPADDVVIFEGRVNGKLCFPLRGDKGFGYDPCFIPDGYTQSFGEMPPGQKQRLSHRARAFDQLLDWLN